MSTNNQLGTAFATSGFELDPNLSPNNQNFALAVLAVVRRAGISGGTGTGGGGTGSVTSVALTEDGGTGLFTVSGSPITTAGTINLALNTQSANTVLAGPRSGAGAQPAFRTIALGTDLSDVTITAPAIRQPLQWDGTAHWVNGTNYQPLFQRGASFSGGANNIVIPTNNVAIYIPEDCNIIGVEVLTAGGTGSCVLDIWKTPYGSYPPNSGNSITASAKPTITGGIKYQDTTLTGWTTALSANDTLLVNLTSCSGFTYVMLVLTMQPVGSTVYNGYTNAQAQAAVISLLGTTVNKVSGTATNGTSTFFMRADAAPALDWAQSPTWTGNHTYTPVSGTAITVNMPSGTAGLVITVPAPTQAGPALVIQGTGTGGFYGLQVVSGGTYGAISISGTQGTFGATDFELVQSGKNAAVYNGASGTLGLYSGQVLGLQLAPGNLAVLGTGTAYAWGTGTNYPTLQFAGVGAVFGTATMGLNLLGGGMYFNGTSYVYGQAGTGVLASLGTGTFAVSCVGTSGTAGGTSAPTVVFSVSGTITSNKVQAWGPKAAALVDMTPDRVTLLATLAIAVNTVCTATLVRNGNQTTIWVPAVTGSGNGATTTMVLTVPMDAAFQNAGTLSYNGVAVQSAGTNNQGLINYSGTTFTCFSNISGGTFTGITNRGLPNGLLMTWPH